MGFTGSIIVYVSIWWIVFFSIFPLRIKSQNLKFKEQLTGKDPGGPKKPKMGKKFLITTLITTVIFIIIYYLVSIDYLNLRNYLQ